MKLNNKQKSTLERILETPTRTDVNINEVRTLINGLGGVWDEKRSGSRFKIGFNDNKNRIILHKPHPEPLIKRKALRSLAEFLCEIFEDDFKKMGLL